MGIPTKDIHERSEQIVALEELETFLEHINESDEPPFARAIELGIKAGFPENWAGLRQIDSALAHLDIRLIMTGMAVGLFEVKVEGDSMAILTPTAPPLLIHTGPIPWAETFDKLNLWLENHPDFAQSQLELDKEW